MHFERAFLPPVSSEIDFSAITAFAELSSRDRVENFDLIMWPYRIVLVCLSVVVLSKEDPLYPSEVGAKIAVTARSDVDG